MRTDWIADMKCHVCGYIDTSRSLQNMTRKEALEAPLDCPNCDTQDGLEVIPSTLHEAIS